MISSSHLDLGPSAIAITGISGRFPGARTIPDFWQNLCHGVESIESLSDAQLLADGCDPSALSDPAFVKRAAVLDDIDLFDAGFFGLSPRDASIMDPQHRIFLECAWEALERAGWNPDEFPGTIGVFAGSGMNSYLIFNLLPNHALLNSVGLFLLKQTGNDKDVLATRVSYQLNLTGPSMSIQTACSTSLVAAHVACQSLLNHECDMALAGGVSIEIPHKTGYFFREGEILSRDGSCRAFDAAATGTVFGSGAGVVVLRRLADALADGDHIHAVIRGSAVNNDGSRKVGYLAPSVSGQADVVAEAISVANVDAQTISYVETHGTGTLVGDPIEIAALTQAFRQTTPARHFCGVGSLKPNIGHLDAAAGVAGLIKTTLALENRQIPPSLHFSNPNPRIDFANSPFYVNQRLTDWQTAGGPRRAGVTSLGIGGTNAHVVLEEAPAAEKSGAARPWQVLTLSAKTAAALEAATHNLAAHLEKHPGENLADVAFTGHRGRKAFPFRRAVVSESTENAVRAVRAEEPKRVFTAHVPAEQAEVAFLFPGQGSQYVNMARGVYAEEAAFRSQVDLCSELLKPQLGFDLRSALFCAGEPSDQDSQRLAETWITQPALFVIEFALARLWMSWGIRPAAMIGHSLGEFVAACLAGTLSLEDALSAVASRGRLMQSAPAGAMLAVALSEPEAVSRLSGALSLAAINGPRQCVLSGPEDAIAGLQTSLSRDEVLCHRLHTSHAFHSASMDSILESFIDVMARFQLKPPSIPYLSNVTGTWIKAEEATNPAYWAQHLRQTVRFADGLKELFSKSRGALLEVGPGRVLSGFAMNHPVESGRPTVLCSTRNPREATGDLQFLMSSVAQLWASGVKLDWAGFHAAERRQRVALPTYPFERKRFWIDAPKPDRALREPVDPAPSRPSQDASGPPDPVAYYRPVWKRSALPAITWPDTAANAHWLIFLDAMGVGAEIAELLRLAGHPVVTLIPGERFQKIDNGAYSLRPGYRPDYDDLFADLLEARSWPSRILHLWSLVPEDRERPALDSLAQTMELSFHSLVALAQAMGRQDVTTPVALGIVSNGLQQVAGEPVHRTERAALFGPGAVIPKEFSHIHAQCIDIGLEFARSGGSASGDRATVIQQILRELLASPAETLVAYRGQERWVPALEPMRMDRRPDVNRLRRQGVYVITGGLGGLGLVIAEHLAQSLQAKLVLVGRTVPPPRSAWDEWLETHAGQDAVSRKILKIQSLEKSGSEVLLVREDVTDPAGMERMVLEAQRKFGAIHGVFHAAGVLHDGLIQLKEREDADRVLAPKIKGTLVLDAALHGTDLDFFALFSSVSCFLAPVGQVDYVAANAFLDVFAHAHESTHRNRFVSINWARWRDVGMGAQSAGAQSIPGPLAGNPEAGGRHPLLSACLVDSPGTLIYRTVLTFNEDWIINEHRLRGGDGLFPGTGYVELARGAMQRRFGDGAIQLRGLSFNAPLSVAVGHTREVRTCLVREGDSFLFSTFLDSPGPGPEAVPAPATATASLRYLGTVEPASIDIDAILERCRRSKLTFGPDYQNPKQARYIEFGPRWRCLKRIHFGAHEALSFLEIPEQFASDLGIFRAHPAFLDAITGSAMLTIPGYEHTHDLYVPVSYGSFTLFSGLPRKCYCHIRSAQANSVRKEVAAFDLTLADEAGVVIAEIENFVVRRLTNTAMLSGAGPAPHQAEHVAKSPHQPAVAAVEPSDGLAALVRILDGEQTPQVLVVPAGMSVLAQGTQPVSLPDGLHAPSRAPARPAADDDPPENEIERSLQEWWKELLGVPHVDRLDDFFELGGHSLIAVRLFAKIKKRYGPDLNLAKLFEARTIEALANLVNAEVAHNQEEASPWPSMVRIQTGGRQAPLFFVHGLGGNIISFNNLVRHLGPGESVYALQAQGLDGKQPVLTRVEDMAEQYIREIQTVQPTGPYYFAGYSFGGLVAYEMAQQLQAQGHRVSFVALFDTRQMRYRNKEASSLSIEMLARYLRRLKRLLSEPGGRRLIKARFKEKLLQLIYFKLPTGALIRHFYKADSRPVPRTVAVLQAANIEAAVNYVPKPYRGRLTVFRAKERPPLDQFDWHLGWNGLASEGVAVNEVPGSHITLGDEPNVTIMADFFKQALHEARQRDDTGVNPPLLSPSEPVTGPGPTGLSP